MITACWTMWQTLAWPGRRWRTRINPEHDPDDILRPLNTLDQQTNDLALGGPIRGPQTVAYHRGEQIQFANDPLKRAGLLFGPLLLAGLGFKSGQAPTQLSDARFELGFLDQALRIAVDQAVNRTPHFGQLAGEGVELKLVWMSLKRVEPPLVLLDHERRVFQQPTDLGPNRLIEQLHSHEPSITSELAVESAAIGAATSIVAPLPAVVMTREPIPARLADQQAAQQILDARKPLAIAPAVLLQPLCGTREQALAHDRRHRDADVPLGRGGNLSVRPFGQAVVTARRMKGRLPWQTRAPTIDCLTGVGRIEEHGVDHGPAPVPATRWARDAVAEQAPAHPGERQALVPDPGEDLTHNPGCVLIDLIPGGPPARLPRDIAIAERRAGEDADGTALGPIALSAPTALEHLGPLVFGEHTLELEQQAVLRRVSDRAIEEDRLRASTGKLLQQQHLMRVAAGEAIRGVNVDDIKR